MKIHTIQGITSSGHEAPSQPRTHTAAGQRPAGVTPADARPSDKPIDHLMPGDITTITALRAQSATIIKAGQDEVIFSARVGGARRQFSATRISFEHLRIVSLRAAQRPPNAQADDKAETSRKPSRTDLAAAERPAADTEPAAQARAQLLARYRLTQGNQ